MIRTHGLTKRFGRVRAVDDVDLDVREGDVYGFLGANGSGKTTTVRMLLGLVLATSGDIEVLGRRMPRSARDVLPSVGALIEGPGAYPHLSGRANLATVDAAGPGRRAGRRRVAETLEQVGLDPADRRPVRAYSLGMRQRLGLASALLRRPPLLMLDEPTNGLDPQGIREMRDLLVTLNREGTTIFLSSHLLAEIEQMCTRVGVLDRGRLVVQDELTTLTGPTGLVRVVTTEPARAVQVLSSAGHRDVRPEGETVLVPGRSAEVNETLVRAGVPVAEVGPQRRSLEDVVLEATDPGVFRGAGAA
ncbi:multidrug ABC transporter ATP-binding protein [Marmoricola endophyticus]|uniref:Multidrug ABC transporter ATP-binding protein n=1 Tax=Marmoricola endophyticus TaxID=2040280 RepID=A0A917BCP2_9ACTN|nr:ABC transporter ATP-binding protein [Marmoricola endophyticus]GGF37623.1 multidrug ABC transporter ATP-binding protein [Marmoricola endophyticus]